MIVRVLNGRAANLVFWLLLAVQAALAARIAYPWLSADSSVYLELARSLADGRYGLVTANGFEWDALRPPGYPIILWLLLQVAGLPIVIVVALQLAAYLAAIWLVDRYVAREETNRAVFRLLVLIYPFAAVYSAYVMTEAWTILAICLLAAILCSFRRTGLSSALAGVVCGVAALFRSDLLLLPIVAAAALLILSRREIKRNVALAAILLASSIATLLPYALWNERHFGVPSPAPVAGALGTSLYLSTWQGRVPLSDLNALYSGQAARAAVKSGLIGEVSEVNRSIGAQPLTAPFNPAAYPTQEMQIAMNKAFGAKALRRIRDEPSQYARHVLRNLWALWNTTEYPPSLPAAAKTGLFAISFAAMLAGYAGAFLSLVGAAGLARWRPAALLLLYPLGIHMWLHTEARYTASVRPLLLLFAALTLVECYRRMKGPEVGLAAADA